MKTFRLLNVSQSKSTSIVRLYGMLTAPSEDGETSTKYPFTFSLDCSNLFNEPVFASGYLPSFALLLLRISEFSTYEVRYDNDISNPRIVHKLGDFVGKFIPHHHKL